MVIVGAGGYGLEVLLYAREAKDRGWPHTVDGFIDDGLPAGTVVDGGLGVLGPSTHGGLLSGGVIIAVGDADARAALAARVRASGGELVTLVHHTAYVASSATVGAGSILCPFSMVAAHARIGSNVSMNVYASVGHEAVVGDHAVLSPYSALLGRTHVGDRCYVATHATVAPGVEVGAQSKVSAGAAVMRDAPPGSLLVGNPAKGRVMFRVDG